MRPAAQRPWQSQISPGQSACYPGTNRQRKKDMGYLRGYLDQLRTQVRPQGTEEEHDEQSGQWLHHACQSADDQQDEERPTQRCEPDEQQASHKGQSQPKTCDQRAIPGRMK